MSGRKECVMIKYSAIIFLARSSRMWRYHDYSYMNKCGAAIDVFNKRIVCCFGFCPSSFKHLYKTSQKFDDLSTSLYSVENLGAVYRAYVI